MEQFKVFSSPRKIYTSMLRDMKNAKSSIYLETYQFDDDKVGRRFRKVIHDKVKEGVKVGILVDSWQSTTNKDFFKSMIKDGARVKFFREIKYVLRFISKNHERNHRKLLIIDKHISYVGSANITGMGLDWRELVVRFEGDISKKLFRSFVQTWKDHGKITKKRINRIIHKSFKIISDMPSQLFTPTQNQYLDLLNKAKSEILIITPYFVPSIKFRTAFVDAVERGVNVIIITPFEADVTVVNFVRSGFMGRLFEKGVNIYTYMPTMIHSKLLVVDKKFFLFGSSNLDYRSFMHLHEINLVGRDKEMIRQLREYFSDTMKDCKMFNHNKWKKRSSIQRIAEMIVYFGRRYL